MQREAYRKMVLRNREQVGVVQIRNKNKTSGGNCFSLLVDIMQSTSFIGYMKGNKRS